MINKISNLLKALAISVPLIFTNPLKAQKPGDTTIVHLMNNITAKTTFFKSRRITNFLLNRAIKESEEILKKDSLIKENYTREEALKLIKKVDSIVIPKLDLHYYPGGKGWLSPPKETSDSCMVITKAHMGVYDALNIKNMKATITNRHHITIRFDSANDGHDAMNPSSIKNKGDFNWDVLSKEITPDSTYIKIQKTNMKSIENGCYLSNLDENKLLSLAYWRNGRNLYIWRRELPGFPHPENADSLLNKKIAVEELTKSIALNKKFPVSYYHRGLNKIVLENYDGAIEDFSKTIELDSNFANAYVGLAHAFVKKGEYRKALKNAEKSLNSEVRTNLNEVYFHFGEAYFGLKEYKKAWGAYYKYQSNHFPHWIEKYRNSKNARRIKKAEENMEIIETKVK